MAETKTQPKENDPTEPPAAEAAEVKKGGKLYALSNIRHGNPDGSITEIPVGELVKGIPDDAVEKLIEAGVVGNAPRVTSDSAPEEIAKRDARIAELEAALEAARNEKTAPSN